jgi:hypothetical protein
MRNPHIFLGSFCSRAIFGFTISGGEKWMAIYDPCVMVREIILIARTVEKVGRDGRVDRL